MIGLEVDGKPLTRAYSIASANHDEHLEFFSIKVQNGPLTSRLQHLQDRRPHRRRPQTHRHAGTARPEARQAPVPVCHRYRSRAFLALIQDPETYERFDNVVLVPGVRWVNELAYADKIARELPNHEFFGDWVRES